MTRGGGATRQLAAVGTDDGHHPREDEAPADERAPGLRFARHGELLAPVADHRVTLVLGPAGSGKSTLLGRLADDARPRMPVAVHRPSDDAPTVAALLWGLRSSVLGALGRTDGGRPWTDPADALRHLRARPEPLLVVVDDVHRIEGSAAGAALASLVAAGPPAVRWVVASRGVPSLDLTATRLAGGLHEIGPDDLKVRPWEVEQLFAHWYGRPLPPDETAELTRVTDGWIAGLHLFHLATVGRSSASRRRTLRSVATWGTVRDHLDRTLLAPLEEGLRDFLVGTSPLDVLTGPLCDALLDGHGGRDALRAVHRATLFTREVADGTWRPHPMVGEHLRARLVDEVGAEDAAARHRRAGDLLAEAGEHSAALAAYARAGAWGPLVTLLRTTGADPGAGGAQWIGLLPSGPAGDATVSLAVARSRVAEGALGPAASAYRTAIERRLPPPLDEAARRESAAVAAWTSPAPPPSGWVGPLLRGVRGDPRQASREALDLGGDAAPLVAGLLAVLAGDLALAARLIGRTEGSPDATPVEQAVAALALSGVEVVGGGTDRDIRRAATEAGSLGVGWLSEVAHALVVVADPGAAVDRVSDVMRRRRDAGDPLGAAIAAVVVVLGRMVHDARPDPRRPGAWRGRGPAAEATWSSWLARAAEDARSIGAATVESWARSLGALLAVRRSEPDARSQARTADDLARTAAVPGARAVAVAALGACGGPSSADHLHLAEELATECLGGLPRGFRRMVDWAVAPARATVPLDPLLGRRHELDALLRTWGSAVRGGRAVRVTGHAGSGVSTLLAHLAENVRDRGGPVVRVDGGAVRAESLWVTVARRWPIEAGPLAWADDGGRVDPEAAAAVHAATGVLAEATGPGPGADALAALIALSGRARPVLLVVDHVRLVDADGRALLADLLARVVDLPVVVAIGHRRPSSPDLRALTPTEVVLDALDAAALAELLGGRGLPHDPEAVASLLHVTGGLPALVHEVLSGDRATSPGRAHRPTDGVPWRVDEVPDGARLVADAQIADLPADAVDLVRAAAVLGVDVDAGCVAAALGRALADVEGGLALARHVGLLRTGAVGPLRFGVPALAAHLAAEVPGDERARLLVAAADHLAAHGDESAREVALLLAAAEIDGTPIDGERLATAAARALAGVGVARRPAVLSLADAAAARVPAPSPGSVALHLARARAHRADGRVGEAGRALRSAVLAAVGDDEALARVAVEVAVGAGERGLDPDDIALLDDIVGPDQPPDGPGQVIAAWLAVHRPTERGRDLDALAGPADDACAWAEDRDPRFAALALAAWHGTQWTPGSLAARTAAARGMADAAARAGDADLGSTAARLARAAALEAADAVGADVELARALRPSEGRASGRRGWWAAAASAGRALLDGRPADAIVRMAEVDRAADDAPTGTADLVPAVVAAAVARDGAPPDHLARSGRWPTVDPAEEDVALRLAGRALDAWVAAWSGETAAARVEVSRFVGASLDEVPAGPRWLPTVVWLAEAASEVDDADLVAPLYRALLPWAGRLVVIETVVVWGSTDVALGRLAVSLGDLDAAVGHLDAAVDVAQRIGSLPLVASAQVDAGRARLRRDAPGDRTAARGLAAAALDAARSVDMVGLEAGAERLLADVRPPTRARRVVAGRGAGPVAPHVRVRCLGAFDLQVDGQPIDLSPVRPRARHVLWALALRGGALVNRQQLADALWSERDEAAARRSLQTAVSSLRTASSVEGWAGRWSLIDRDADAYRLALGPDDDCDVVDLDRTLRRARTTADPASRAAALEDALALYRGELLPEAGPAEWVVGERRRWQLAAADAALDAARLRVDLGALDLAARDCEAGIVVDRYRDALWLLLVEVREAQGDRAAAARARTGHAAMLAELDL